MTKKVKLRSLIIGGGFTLLFVVLITRVYWVQVVEGAKYVAEVKENQWSKEKIIQPVRGSILDRNGKVLAEDSPAFTLALVPQTIKDNNNQEEVVKGLAAILATSGDPTGVTALEDKIRKRFEAKREWTPTDQIEIRNEGWKIDSEKADKINQLVKDLQAKLPKKNTPIGIVLLPEIKRFYPAGQLAAHLIGYSNKEGKSVMGIEAQLDNYLKGVPGFLNYEKDRYGVELTGSKSRYQPAVNGSNVQLTIDKNIQFYIENALQKTYDKWHPKSLTAIAVDPKTMEILGIANMPTFNPNKYGETKNQSDFINHAVASQYEPGSTFKIVTLAAAVEEGVFFPEDKYQSGKIIVADRELHDHNSVGWGRISYLEGLKRSSNVAFVKLGLEKLGPDKLRQYIDNFGFGSKTGVDIPGEVAGRVKMQYAPEYATATYGQGLTTTMIQQTAAYAAIANGGKLMWPHVIKQITNPDTGEVIEKYDPKVIREVVTPETAKQVGEYLEQVVSDQEKGTGRKAYIEGYRVAGKTGTANFVLPGQVNYAVGRWMVSFIGYAPLEDPQILVAIMADDPDLGGNYHLGSDVTAPAFKEIVSQTLRYMGIAPSTTVQQTSQPTEKAPQGKMPDLTDQSLDEAKSAMNKFGISVEPIGQGPKVIAQSPLPGTEIGGAQRMYVLMQEGEDLPVPNLSGKSLRDALEVCSFLKVRCQSTGEGYVSDQALEGSGESRVLTLQLKSYKELQETAVAGKTDKSDKSDKSGKSDKTAKADSSSAKTTGDSGKSGTSKKNTDPVKQTSDGGSKKTASAQP
ncbi:penicillin-binding transpeptidase domain-containing protein [Paenibacillus oleatilyticus]|uniref:penicillin-binding transpeptidase domain-containing protein n=1 Tax=Paenibacillus oleatilyticus TaxID=2594886 RepID=UPI001C1F4E0C|nr:penicillin-binding transpeptidase domain-containing protein [Paenibacillus oleatilyticus]MBU7320181.1 PASTA domain-containing protein [Paenibacillus oleatilyticus]